jgi:glycosyltransferase involved in cell wall biosynthesis
VRVLQINKFGTRTSGADNYFLDLGMRLAESMEVGYVCMRPEAVPIQAPVFEVPDVEFHQAAGILEEISAARRVLWSKEAARTLEQALSVFRPNIIHVHNYAHQLSSSILALARRAGIPTIATAHDYKLICPAYTAMRDGETCFRCAKGTPVHCLAGRCLHGSVSWSAVAATEAVLVRSGRSKRVPGCVLAPSQYMAERLNDSWLRRAGVPIHVLRNPIESRPRSVGGAGQGEGLYVGRLSAEKGLDLLINAAARAAVPLTIVGDGPERAALEQQSLELSAPVRFTGFLMGEALEKEWSRSSFFAMTPNWPENAPLALLEALARGLPALLTSVGGLPELVDLYGGGRLIASGDTEAAVSGLRAAAKGQLNSADVTRLVFDLNWETHVRSLLARYEEVAGLAD